jgi:hypothetical protein
MQEKQFSEIQANISKIVHELKTCPYPEHRKELLHRFVELIAEAEKVIRAESSI